ncbi:unnamed protein product [Vicia faba]|uniref:Uncharacterized protein n=1 Tax=Vicia faba TaxID=3906 RepID=A0AAV0YT67_VICFA|nr:unnamed protein product [Vicia faba]
MSRKPTATAVLTNGEYEHLNFGEETKVVNASDRLETTLCGETPDKLIQVNNCLLHNIEAENIDEIRATFSLTVSRCLVRSMPLEFTIKTLTRDLQVNDVVDFFSCYDS